MCIVKLMRGHATVSSEIPSRLTRWPKKKEFFLNGDSLFVLYPFRTSLEAIMSFRLVLLPTHSSPISDTCNGPEEQMLFFFFAFWRAFASFLAREYGMIAGFSL